MVAKFKIYCFDIDGTLCTQNETNYEDAEPYVERITQLNALYDAGHTIFLYTARGTKTGIDWSKVTRQQMALWGVKYHRLFFGKPYADFYIDDKAINPKNWLNLKSKSKELP